MIAVKLSGRPGGPYAPLLVGDTGMPLVEQCHYIENVFGGLLAHPELYPSPQNYEEIRYSLSAEDGSDLLGENCPVATSIGEEDVARLQKGLAALRAMQTGALTTQRAAIEAFRVPNFQRHSRFYRQCTDPTTGERRLAIIWGVGVRDELGQVLDDGPIVNATHGALVALLPPIATPETAPVIDLGQEDATGVSTLSLNPPPPASTGPSKCKCWTVATVFLLVLALLAGLFYWWANRQYTALAAGQKTLADSLAVLGDQVDVLGKKLDKTANTITARLDATDKKLDESSRSLTARLDATDKKMEENHSALVTRLDATDKKLEETTGALTTRLDAVETRLDNLEQLASDSAKKIGSLQAQVEMLNTDLGILRSNLASVHQNVEAGSGGLGFMRSEMVKQRAALEGAKKDIKGIHDAFPDKLGAPVTPDLMDLFDKQPDGGLTGSGFERRLKGIHEGLGDEFKKPTRPKPDEVRGTVEKTLQDTDRTIEFPPNSLPPGVIPPKRESELLDKKKWTVPLDVKGFTAKGSYVDGQGNKEPFDYTYHGRGGVVSPPGPQVVRTDYVPVNPDDEKHITRKPGERPTLKEGAPPVELRQLGYGADGQPVTSQVIRLTPGGKVFELPLRTTWKKIRGDAKVAEEYVGDTPPPLLESVDKVTTNVYEVRTVDRTGKQVAYTAAYEHAHQP